MNARSALNVASGPVAHHVAFSADCRFFSVALDTGFAIFRSETCETHLEQGLAGSLRTATILGNSQIVGLTSGGARANHEARKLVLWDTYRQAESAAITCRSPIIRAVLTDHHIAVVHEDAVSLYRHQPQIEKLASYDTVSNSLGLCCMGRNTIVFPGRTAGHIQVLSLASRNVNIIPAHSSALKALALSADDQVVASASANGTLIRVHATATCSRTAELRRGMGQADIYSIGISPSGNRLAVTSDSSTLHVFDLPKDGPQDPETAEGGVFTNVQKWGSLARLPFAPRVFTDLYSFASTTFDPGNEQDDSSDASAPQVSPKVQKGVVGWLDDSTIFVINAGRDARYERFALIEKDGSVGCARVGWSRFLRPN